MIEVFVSITWEHEARWNDTVWLQMNFGSHRELVSSAAAVYDRRMNRGSFHSSGDNEILLEAAYAAVLHQWPWRSPYSWSPSSAGRSMKASTLSRDLVWQRKSKWSNREDNNISPSHTQIHPPTRTQRVGDQFNKLTSIQSVSGILF